MMKDLFRNGFIVVLVVGILYILYLKECEGPDPIPEGYILVSQESWDSLLTIAKEPNDTTFIIDFIPGPTVYLPRKPVPYPVSVGIDTNLYQDSIVNRFVNVWVDAVIAGEILHWDWKYNPITKKVETIVRKKIPVPVPFEVSVYQRELFLSGVVGGNMNAFSFGVDLDFVNKKRNIYGIQYRRMGNDDFYYFKIGSKIKIFNK